MDNWYSRSQGAPCINESGEVIPPFACMEVDSTSIDGSDVILHVIKPTTAGIAKGPGVLVFNGEIEIPIDGTGFSVLDDVCHAIEASSIGEGVECGPTNASWKLSASGGGYWKLASDADAVSGGDDVMIVRRGGAPATPNKGRLFKTPGGGIPAASGSGPYTWGSATCTEVDEDGTVLGTTETIKNIVNQAIAANVVIKASPVGDSWFVDVASCG